MNLVVSQASKGFLLLPMELEIKNKRWTDDEFFKVRSEVLTTWKTGKDVNLDEAIAYHRALPEHKIFSAKLNKAQAAGETPSIITQ